MTVRARVLQFFISRIIVYMTTTERTFGNYVKLMKASNGRYEQPPVASHEYSRTKLFQKYGNSFIVTIPGKKVKFIIGPHWIGIIVTVCVIIGGTWLNLRMLHRHTEYSQQTVFSFELFIAFFSVWTHILLFLTATSDPGIIFASASKNCESADGFNLNEAEYCDVCSVYQHDNMRVHHCYDCNYCIEGMDHHCPWMGQCIGKKNMKWFLLFNTCWVIFFAEFVYVALTK